MNKLELYKKKLLYRSSYRGTKEMDILLSNFVKKHINSLNESQLIELDKFLSFEDNDILDFYNNNLIKKDIDKNEISKIFKEFLL
jgi:antitoxin CptB